MVSSPPSSVSFPHASSKPAVSTGETPLPRGHLAKSGDIFGWHDWELLPASSELEARDDAKHPTMHRTAPTTENYLAQNSNSSMAEKPSSTPGTQVIHILFMDKSGRQEKPNCSSFSPLKSRAIIP